MSASDQREDTGTRVRPWAALVLPPLAWYVFEIGSASALRVSCPAVGGWLGPTWGAACLVVCAIAGWVAWPVASGLASDQTPPQPWLARIALFIAGIFALAITFQTIATLIIPPCAR